MCSAHSSKTVLSSNSVPTGDVEPGVGAAQGLVAGLLQLLPQPAHAAPARALPHAEEPGPGAENREG